MALKSKSSIKHTVHKAQADLDKFDKEISKNSSVTVGLPKNSSPYPNGVSVILVALVHEFGSLIRNIPERSFLRAGIRRNAKKYQKLFKILAKESLDGNGDFLRGLSKIGLQAQTDVREEITNVKKPPLKSREGNPLVDTGHLRGSITYQVVKKNDN